jgi:hypothetical protein
VKIVVAILLVAGLLALVPLPSASQADLSKVLIGRWEGGNEAVLLFESVRQEGDRWVAIAKFGGRGQPPRPVDVTMEVSGGGVTLHFKPAPDFEWKLALRGDAALDGTVRTRGRVAGGASRDLPVRLEKVR